MNFRKKVYSLVRKIPKKRVVTYKQISGRLNSGAYRSVGNILNKNTDKAVPCHRVIKSDGNIGGFNKGAKQKIKLLKKEGIEIIDNKIDLKIYRFKFR
jgi:methylated-DNA-[protein]-cysteine S-methyltransferase